MLKRHDFVFNPHWQPPAKSEYLARPCCQNPPAERSLLRTLPNRRTVGGSASHLVSTVEDEGPRDRLSVLRRARPFSVGRAHHAVLFELAFEAIMAVARDLERDR